MINVDYLKSKSPIFPFIHFETFRNELTGSTIVPFHRNGKVYLRHLVQTYYYTGIDGNVTGTMYDIVRFQLVFEANNTKKYAIGIEYDDEIVDESINEYKKPKSKFRTNLYNGRIKPAKRK